MKIYLAGPDVFRPDAESWANSARELCRQYGFEALTPLDHCETEPRKICEGNLELIRKAQMVVANLNPFRGAEPDSGTAFEQFQRYLPQRGPCRRRDQAEKENQPQGIAAKTDHRLPQCMQVLKVGAGAKA
jgi:hypothetical protein